MPHTSLANLHEYNDAALAGLLSTDGPPVFVLVYAPWSKPARTMLHVVDELVPAYSGLLRFALINADTARESVARHGVLSLPSYLMLRRGRLVDRFIGLQTKERLVELIEAGFQKV